MSAVLIIIFAFFGSGLSTNAKSADLHFLSYYGRQLMLEQYNGTWETAVPEYPFGRGINLSIATDELDDIVARLQNAEYPIMLMPEVSWYRKDKILLGERHILVQDPDGYLLRFPEHIGSKAA